MPHPSKLPPCPANHFRPISSHLGYSSVLCEAGYILNRAGEQQLLQWQTSLRLTQCLHVTCVQQSNRPRSPPCMWLACALQAAVSHVPRGHTKTQQATPMPACLASLAGPRRALEQPLLPPAPRGLLPSAQQAATWPSSLPPRSPRTCVTASCALWAPTSPALATGASAPSAAMASPLLQEEPRGGQTVSTRDGLASSCKRSHSAECVEATCHG